MENGVKKDKVTCVILAAGQGKRMNTHVAKQFIMLEDKPILYYSLKAFEESKADEIILVCGHGQIEYCKNNIIKPYGLRKIKHIIEGGTERYNSVYLGLRAIDHSDYVLIHDGARPFISTPLINEVIDVVRESNACIVATPVKDTIKIVGKDGWIKETPDRANLWSAQTPQAFDYDSIRKAYELLFKDEQGYNKNITDDAMVYEIFIKKPVKIVRGDYKNIKITTIEDLALAQTLLESV
ncbi:MAG: 2-C-methyl-D-erythritol 4-phosphate cytidylyltransferase [Clostridiales bacterium]|nr:2-C-methyl-D-erythritol 4-phosphate cytidylyltransferase [Clostridiales bacterium]